MPRLLAASFAWAPLDHLWRPPCPSDRPRPGKQEAVAQAAWARCSKCDNAERFSLGGAGREPSCGGTEGGGRAG